MFGPEEMNALAAEFPDVPEHWLAVIAMDRRLEQCRPDLTETERLLLLKNIAKHPAQFLELATAIN